MRDINAAMVSDNEEYVRIMNERMRLDNAPASVSFFPIFFFTQIDPLVNNNIILQGERIQCPQCDGSYRAGYRRQHILSTRHKRSFRGLSNNDSMLNGIVLRSIEGEEAYDVSFLPPNENDFSRPVPSSSEEALGEASLQGDFLAIEDFFVHFQRGIVSRVEEATTRLVKKRRDRKCTE